MKLLSDFDGVWTNPAAEARAQGEYLDATLLEWTAKSERASTAEWLARSRAETIAEPTRYGWAPGGRISAFADEDPFSPHSALLHYLHLHRGDDLRAAALCAAIEAHGFSGLEAFGGEAHAKGVQRVVATRGPGILPAAAEAGKRLLERGLEIVVVSNSGTDKLAAWFDHAGVPQRAYPERAKGALCLRGSARKFVLDGPEREPLMLGTTKVDIARPHYDAILRDERPDAVVGDVFSLDLALPLALRRREPAFEALRLLWLIHDYTPPWLRREVERYAPEVEAIEGGFVAMAERLLPGGRAEITDLP